MSRSFLRSPPKLNKRDKPHPKKRPFERELWESGFARVAGVDEAGRGPLAGPVVAAACVLSPKVAIRGVHDSKQLTRQKRLALFELLRRHADVQIGIGIIDSETIDQINIFQATIRAMWKALEELNPQPDCILVDGRPIPHPTLTVKGIVGGDALCYAIAAASIIAKETRDRLMEEYHQMWPEYGFDRHKGYATRDHVEALHRLGPCPIHRRSFKPDRYSQELVAISGTFC